MVGIVHLSINFNEVQLPATFLKKSFVPSHDDVMIFHFKGFQQNRISLSCFKKDDFTDLHLPPHTPPLLNSLMTSAGLAEFVWML